MVNFLVDEEVDGCWSVLCYMSDGMHLRKEKHTHTHNKSKYTKRNHVVVTSARLGGSFHYEVFEIKCDLISIQLWSLSSNSISGH